MEQSTNIELLQECRQIMTKRMRGSITGMLNEVDETLLKMAQDHEGGLNESACYEAVREIRLKRTEIKLRFERRFINLFENGVKMMTEEKHNSDYRNGAMSETSLFSGLNEMETTSLKESVGTVKKTCGQVLLELDKKMDAMLEIAGDNNPVHPEYVFDAFREACWDIKSGEEVRRMMFKIFEKRIATELQGIYQDINELITSRYATPRRKKGEPMEFKETSELTQSAVMLRYEVITRIEKRLDGHPVPDFARAFLLKHWRLFLENVYNKYSENSIAWNAARQTMDDLIWSVGEISSIYDRQQLVQLLPSLLFRLLNGMNVIGMKDTEIDAFLKQLKAHQLKSLDQGDDELLDTIAEEAKESVSRTSNNNVYH